MSSKVREFLSSITVEPVLFVYCFGVAMYTPVYQQLFRGHICRQLDNYTEEVCANLSAHADAEAHVRGQWAVWNWYASAVQTVPGIIFAVFVAPWSDTYGRKWMMLAPPSFAIIASLQLLANVYWPTLPTWQLLLVMITDSVSGGMLGLLTACMAYAADVTDKSATRTIHIAMLEVSLTVGWGIGSMLSAFLYSQLGAAACFIGYFICSVFNVFYIIFRVKETRTAPPDTTLKQRAIALVDVESVRRVWRTVTKRRGKGRHRQMRVWFAAFFLRQLCSSAWVGLPFIEFPPFSWTLSFYMMYWAIWTYIDSAFLTFVFPLIKFRLKVLDGTLTIVGIFANIIGHVLYFYAWNSWFLYAASVVFFFDVQIIAQRALFSRTVDDDEQGCIFAMITVIEKATPLLGGLVFSHLFQATAATMPSFIFGLGALLLVVPLALYAWADVIDRCTGLMDE